MIHYALQCGAGHVFDGWFKDSASFDLQSAQGLLECTSCGATSVRRALMSPRLNKGVAGPRQQAPVAAQEAPAADAPAPVPVPVPAKMTMPPMPDQMRAVLQRIRAEVEKKCDYVGPEFAQAARRMHSGAEPHRSIYGEATSDEADALAEDGIKVSQIPWVPRADS